MADRGEPDGKTPKKRGRAPVVPLMATPVTPARAPVAPLPLPLPTAAPLASISVTPAPAEPEAGPAAEAPAAPASDPAAPAAVEPAPAVAAAIVPAPVVEPIKTDDTRQPVEPPSKGPIEMATAFQPTPVAAETAEKAKAAFGDMNQRAKAAMEKSVKLGEEMTELTKGNVEALIQSSRVAAKGAETLAQEAAEAMKKNFESASATMKSFASVKSPTELFQLQSEAAKSYFDTAVADMSKFTEQMMKLAGDVAQPISSRYSVAMEKVKATTSL